MKRILNGPYRDRIYAALIMIIVFLYLLLTIPFKEYPACFAPYDFQLDFLEYHMIAINFIKSGSFFIHGLAYDPATYHLCDNHQTQIILEFLDKNGPFIMLNRPPVYIIFLSVMYGLFGIETYPLYIANMLLVSLICALIYLIMVRLTGGRKRYIGLIGVFLFLSYKMPDILQIDAELLSGLAGVLILYSGIRCYQSNALKDYFLFGITVIIGILTKGVFLFVIPIFFLVSLYVFGQYKDLIKKLAFTSLGVAVLLIPWVIFINLKNMDSVEERKLSQEKIAAWTPKHSFSDEDEFRRFYYTGDNNLVTLNMILGYAYYLYMESNPFILVTNQAASESIFMANNEFCTDGEWHLEWKFIKNAYYNTVHLDKPVLVRLILFYYEHPKLFFEIFAGKLASASKKLPSFFWIGASFFGFYLVLRRFRYKPYLLLIALVVSLFLVVSSVYGFKYLFPFTHFFLFIAGLLSLRQQQVREIPLIIPTMYMNGIIVILLIYGDDRFLEIYNCLGIVSALFFGLKIFLHFRQAITLRDQST